MILVKVFKANCLLDVNTLQECINKILMHYYKDQILFANFVNILVISVNISKSIIFSLTISLLNDILFLLLALISNECWQTASVLILSTMTNRQCSFVIMKRDFGGNRSLFVQWLLHELEKSIGTSSIFIVS